MTSFEAEREEVREKGKRRGNVPPSIHVSAGRTYRQ